MTIEISSMSGCDLSQECVEDVYKGTCVKFGGRQPTQCTGDVERLLQNNLSNNG